MCCLRYVLKLSGLKVNGRVQAAPVGDHMSKGRKFESQRKLKNI